MDTSQLVTQEEKDQVADQLVDVMMVGLRTGALSVEEQETSADMLSERIRMVTTRGELLQLLKEAAIKWDIYNSVYMEFKKQDLLTQVEDELQQIGQPGK